MKEIKENINFLTEWIEFEHGHHPKNNEWFWYVASGALIIVILAIFLSNFLFAVLAIIAALVIILTGARKPRKIKFSVGTKGIKAGEKFYPYKELGSFWIHYDPPLKKELIIKFSKKLSQHAKIPLGNADPGRIRNFLIKILKEEEHEESLTEKLAELLGF
ncbi:hypothetical protein KKB69_00790 [Patescibacteria group bacterium]|nr:hypothetical protein [Patescibacteria group bacterium]